MEDAVNIYDIAKLAGTSKSTVSRVLTNHPNVKEETRKRVLDVMKQYQYQPNSIARGLVNGSIQVIALIVSDIRNPFYSETTWFIERELFKNEYRMFLCCSDNDPKKEREFLEMAKQYNFSGIIMISPINEGYLKQNANTFGCPVILLNRYIDNFPGDILTTDNFQAGYMATRYLIELGHTKIALVSGGRETSTHRDRREGFLKALSAYEIPFQPQYDLTAEQLDLENGYTCGTTLLNLREEAPSAVFCTMDLLAIGVLQAYRQAGKSIPEDLSIVGFDDIPFVRLNGISLTTVRQPYEEIGKKAVAMILRRIRENPEQQQKGVLDCKLIIRDSAAKHEEAL